MTKSAIPFFDNMRLQILEDMKDWKVGKFGLVSDWLPYNWKPKNCVDDWARAKYLNQTETRTDIYSDLSNGMAQPIANIGDILSFGDHPDKKWQVTGFDKNGSMSLKPLWK